VKAADRPTVQATLWRLRSARGVQLFPEENLPSQVTSSTTADLIPHSKLDVQLEIVPGALRVKVLDLDGQPVKGGFRLVASARREDGRAIALEPPREDGPGRFVISFAEKVSGPVSASAGDAESGVGASDEAVLP
jgi:hypothetical protein